jgi:hypothetical protein
LFVFADYYNSLPTNPMTYADGVVTAPQVEAALRVGPAKAKIQKERREEDIY